MKGKNVTKVSLERSSTLLRAKCRHLHLEESCPGTENEAEEGVERHHLLSSPLLL